MCARDVKHFLRFAVLLGTVCLVGWACQAGIPSGEPMSLGLRVGAPSADSLLSRAGFRIHHLYENGDEAYTPSRSHTGASRPLTVAVVSDLNGRYGSTDYSPRVHQTVDWLTNRLQPDLVVSTGDHVAGQKHGLDYEAMWDAFHQTVTTKLENANIPFAPTPGNHDASAAEPFQKERRQYYQEWRDRRPNVNFVDGSNFPMNYAFEIGPALFISIDATLPGPLDDKQFNWIKSILRKKDDKAAKFVFGHLPLVPFAKGRQTQILADRDLEKLLKRHDVEMVLSGHHHAYYPGKRGSLKHIGMACLGGGPRELIGTDRTSRHSAVVLRVHPSGHVDFHARWGPQMQRRIDHRELPRSVESQGWKVWRVDVPRRLAKQK